MAFRGVLVLLLVIAPTIARNLDFSQTERYSDFSEDEDISSVAELYHKDAGLHEEQIFIRSDEEMPLGSSLHAEEFPLPSLSYDGPIDESGLDLQDALEDIVSSIPSLLDQNGLPIGLLPSSVASYSITDDGEFTVLLEKACYVKFDYEVYYARTITGKLSYGVITDLSGIQAKEAFFWVPVTGIRTDIPSSHYIYFDVGPISKKLPISQFETVPVCKAKAMAFSALA